MTMTSLIQYKKRLAGLPDETFIGSVLWFSIAGTVERNDGKRSVVPVRVNQHLLRQWFEELGLDESFIPPGIKKVDAFRNASSQSKRDYPVQDRNGEIVPGQFAELRVEEVKSDTEQVIRHVIRVVRDERKEQLSWSHMATLKFIRAGRTAKGKRTSGDHVKDAILSKIEGEDREQVQSLVDEFYERYEDLSEHLHSSAIRGVVRNYLTSLNAIAMKTSGGVYFVHKDSWGAVDALQNLVRRIGQGCVLEQFPLVDTNESRTMLTEAFQSEVEDECRLLLKQIAEVEAAAKGGAVSARRYAELNAGYQNVVARSEEYTSKLGLAQGRAGNALEVALNAVMSMADRIDYGGKGR